MTRTTDTPRAAYFTFTLLFLLYMFDYADRMVIGSLIPFLKADWQLTDTQCGMLLSAVYWSITICTFPISIAVDRWSRRRSIAIMAMLWSLATAACAFTRNFAQLFAAKSAIGLGEAGYAPGGTAMLAGLFPEKKRAQVMGFWNMSIPLGGALGVGLGGLIADLWGWRHAFGMVAIPGFVIALLFFRVRDYRTVELVKTANAGEPAQKMKLPEIARAFLHNPTLLLTYLGFAGNTFVSTSLMFWLPTYFHRTQNLSMSQAGMKTGAIMLLAIVGAPIGGVLADRWRRRRQNARIVFAGICSLITSSLLAASFLAAAGGTLQFSLLLLCGICVVAYLPGAASVTQDVVHPGLRAVSYSLSVITQNLLGSSLGPLAIGALSDRFGLQTALLVLPVSTAAAGLLFLVGSLFHNRDLDKIDQVELSFER